MSTEFKLYDHQQKAVDDTIGELMFGGKTKIVLDAKTSFGKSAYMAGLCRDLDDDNIVIMVTITELIDQIAEHLDHLNLDYSILKSGRDKHFDPAKRIQLIMAQTLYARIETTDIKCDTLIIDEVHISYQTKRYNDIVDKLKPERTVGCSGTPYDSDLFELDGMETIHTWSIDKLEEEGFISPLKYYIPKWSEKVDYSKIKMNGSEYNMSSLDEVINTDQYLNQVVESIDKMKAKELKTIVFCSTIEQCENLADKLRNKGYEAQEVHSKMGKKDNEAIIDAFRNNTKYISGLDKKAIRDGLSLFNEDEIYDGKFVKILLSVTKLSTGFSVKDIDLGIYARRIGVTSLFHQTTGRIIRNYHGLSDLLKTRDNSQTIALVSSCFGNDKRVLEEQLFNYDIGDIEVFDFGSDVEQLREQFDVVIENVRPDKIHGKILDCGSNVAKHGFHSDPVTPLKRTGNKEVDKANKVALEQSMGLSHLSMTLDDELQEFDLSKYELKIEKLEKAQQEVKKKNADITNWDLKRLASIFDYTDDVVTIIKIGAEIQTRKVGRPVSKSGFEYDYNIGWLSEDIVSSIKKYPDMKRKWTAAYRTRVRNIIKQGKNFNSVKFFANFILKNYEAEMEIVDYSNNGILEPRDGLLPAIDIDMEDIPF